MQTPDLLLCSGDSRTSLSREAALDGTSEQMQILMAVDAENSRASEILKQLFASDPPKTHLLPEATRATVAYSSDSMRAL